eukprot:m.3434 g.3434  ORF g.3434 m.3434 type:complete len:443 (-) comp3475_c0_seq1:144-1472(-)
MSTTSVCASEDKGMMELRLHALLYEDVEVNGQVGSDSGGSGDDVYEFTVGAALAALKQSGKLPGDLAECNVSNLVLVVISPNGCFFPSLSTKWSKLHANKDFGNRSSYFIAKQSNPIIGTLEKQQQYGTFAHVHLMTRLKQLKEKDAISEDEYRQLLRIARNERHEVYGSVNAVFRAFGNDTTTFLEEIRDIMYTYNSDKAKKKGEKTKQSFFKRITRRATPPQLVSRGGCSPSGRNMEGSDDDFYASTAGQDFMWILASLFIAFFSFIAMAAQVLFVNTQNVFLGPLIHSLTGFLSLYEVFGYRSILGYEASIQMFGHVVCDFLVVAFSFNLVVEVFQYLPVLQPFFTMSFPFFTPLSEVFASLTGSSSSPLSTVISTFTATVVTDGASAALSAIITLVWLLALRMQWKRAPESDLVMAVLILLGSMYVTFMTHLFLSASN